MYNKQITRSYGHYSDLSDEAKISIMMKRLRRLKKAVAVSMRNDLQQIRNFNNNCYNEFSKSHCWG